MIEHDTVLVLGAGASAPYGLPLGRELVKEIIEAIGTDGFGAGRFLFKHVRANYPKQWRTFIDRLVYSDCESIDAFLEKEENQDLMGIGKESIAAGILQKETISNLFQFHRTMPSWYSQLRSLLLEEATFNDMSSKNNLKIITFNYDRSLEYYLTRVISETFKKSMEESSKKLQETVKIIHVHGRIGPLPCEGFDQQQSTSYEVLAKSKRDILSSVWSELLRLSASNIKIIHEATDDTPEFKETYNYLKQARHIFFFGFGFHPINCRRLKLDNLGAKDKLAYFTCKGLSADRIKDLRKYTKSNGLFLLFESKPEFLAKSTRVKVYLSLSMR